MGAASALRRVFLQPVAASWPVQGFLPGASSRYLVYRAWYSSYKNEKLPRDHEIIHRSVRIRNQNGKLSEPKFTSQVLAGLDLARFSLVVIAQPQKDDGSSILEYPICQIVDRKAEAQERAAAAAKKKDKGKKEIELNWAIASHDLQTKLRHLKSFLEKGLRVEVLLLNKRKGKKKASEGEADDVLKLVKDAAAEVPGTKEYKTMLGNVGGQVRLFLEGPQIKTEAKTPPKMDDAADKVPS
jgi:translation initiation factor IF-3